MNPASNGVSASAFSSHSPMTNASGSNDDRQQPAEGSVVTTWSGSPATGLDGYTGEACGEIVPLVCGIVCSVLGLISGAVALATASTGHANATASPAATPDAVAALALGAALSALGLL